MVTCIYNLQVIIPVALAENAANALIHGVVGFFQNRKASKIHPIDPRYQVSLYAKDNLSIARQFLNSPQPGATNYEQNILAGQSNMLSQVNRSASDGSQALAMSAASQEQASQGLTDLHGQQANWKQGMMQKYIYAKKAMIREVGKVDSDKTCKLIVHGKIIGLAICILVNIYFE